MDDLEREDLLKLVSWVRDRFHSLLSLVLYGVFALILGAIESKLNVIGFGLEHDADDGLWRVDLHDRLEFFASFDQLALHDAHLHVQLRVWDDEEALLELRSLLRGC